jgi:hypothetical protein
LKKIKEKKRLR